MATAGNDTAFGPQYGSRFDFTLEFEQSILGILPTGLVIAAAPLFLYVCKRRRAYARAGIAFWVKFAATVALLGLEIDSLVFFNNNPSVRTDIALAAGSLSCAASFAIIVLIAVEHRYTLRPTSLLSLYIFVSLVLDVAKSRSYFLRHELDTLGGLSAAAAAVKAIIVAMQEVPKTSLLLDVKLKSTLGKEATSGFWNRSVFGWLNSMFLVGFRQTLRMQDLEPLGPALSATLLFKKFKQHWDDGKTRFSSGRLALACFATLWQPFCGVIIPRLLHSGLTFVQPFLLERILKCLKQEERKDYEIIGLVVAAGLVFSIRGLTKAAYYHANYRCVTAVRGVLVAAMADKQLRLPPVEAKKSAIATLMTADVEGIAESLPEVHDMWGFLLDISLGLFLLYKFIGLASLTVFAPFIFSTVYGVIMGNWSGKALAAWNASIESRVARMSNILSQQIPIRMTGLGPLVSRYAQKLRRTEMDYSRQFRICTTTSMTGALLIESFTPVIILAAALFWTRFQGGFTAYVAFPTLSMIAIVQMPLFYLVDTCASIPRLFACLGRIQAYLQLPEWSDNRPLQCREESALDGTPDNEQRHTKSNTDSCQNTENNQNRENGEKSGGSDKTSVVIEFKNAWIGPANHSQATLQNVDLQILRFKIVAVLGSISCGKSTFLRSLIGEGALLHGTLAVARASWAFCGQNPYLVNTSIRANIIGPNPFDEEWYRIVVSDCQLIYDLEQLKDGDETVVGSDGMNLSVGQRHRIAVARAAYSRAEVMVVDDIFGSQDPATAQAMMKRLLGPDGLLRRLKTTVVFATHLGISLDVADELLMIDQTSITHHKTFDSLSMKKMLLGSTSPAKQTSKALNAAAGTSREGQETNEKDAPRATPETKAAENLIRTRGELGLYKFYFGSFAKTRFIVWTLSMVVVVFCDNFPNGYVRIWVERGPNNNLFLLGFALISFMRVAVGLWSQRLFYLRILPQSGERLHQLLLDAAMNATYNFLCTVDSGSLLNRFSQDMSLVVQTLPIAMYRFVFMLYYSLASIAFVLAGSSYASIALPIIAAAVYCVQKYYLRTSRQLRHLDLEAKTPLFVRFKETANGLEHIRSFGWSSSQLEQSLVLLDDSQRAYYQMFCVQRWLNLVLDLMVAAVAVFMVSIAFYVRNSTSPAAMGLTYLTLIEFGSVLTVTVKRWTEMEIALGSIARSRSFVQDTPLEKDDPDCAVPQDWPCGGEVEFRNVAAGYNSDTVLRDVSFKALSGDKVAITGRSGSGKSSLLATLLNFLDHSGSILIDGVEIRKVPRQILRERVTTITQYPVILDGSIRHNLTPFSDGSISDSTVESTLVQVGLWGVVESKGGLDANIQDAGLSVAQGQLLCIARALLHHEQTGSKIILMDEATASLSAASMREVQGILTTAFQGCTVLSIAHWGSPLQQTDLALELASGRLVSAKRAEKGTQK